jgi:hypothetical protein
MPKCPDVPWVGRTEKIKYGKIEVIQGPRKNPVTSITLKEIMESEPYRKLLKNVELRMKRKKPPASANEWEKLNNIWYNLEEFGYTGKSPERALEAIFNWHKKYVKSGEVKIYRAVVIPPDWERLERAWNSRGVGDSWSVLKQGADNYMSQNQFLQAYPVSEIAFVEGRLRFGDIDWDYTIRNNTTWGTKEAELNPHTHAKVFVDKVSFYKLDDSASEKYLKGLVKTTGKTNKPWLGRKNKPFLVVEPKKAYTSYIFPNPRPNPEFWGDEGSGILVVAADTKRILLGLRSEDVNEPLTWGNFGGAIGIDDYGNKEEALSPLKNALKEMKEEIGYSGKITPYKSYTFKSESFIYHNFIGVVTKEAMVKLDKFNWEVSELRWFTMEEVNQLPNLHFGLKSLLDNANPLYSIPIMANPPSRSDQFTKQDIVYVGPSVEKGLSANLLKAIKSKRHQNREYFGYANEDTLWTHTNFEPKSAGVFESSEDKKKFLEDNEIIFGFHTHPISYLQSVLGRGWNARWSDVPSPSDYAYHLSQRVIHGVMAEIVSTQHGFFIIEVMEKKNGPKELTQELFNHDWTAAKNAWEGGEATESYVLTPGQHARDTVRALNSKTKFIDFKVTFYDNPVMAVKWKPADDGGFNGKTIRVNPHYSPPPGIAMFPGELHQGPAALYQQTISISQLNPPRSKPFPWNKNRVKKSPFKTMKKAQATYDLWKKGKAIGFSANSSLKSMGKIPRASGKYELGEKYERINPPEEHIHWDEYHSHMTDYHVDERQNPPWSEDAQVNPYIMMTEPWSKEQVPIDALIAPLIQNLWDNKQKTWYSDQGSAKGQSGRWRGYLILIPPNNYANPKFAALPRSIVRRGLRWEKQFVGKHPTYPKGTKLYQWFDKKNSLKEIYKAFGLVAPSSKTEAERMLENSKAMKNPMAPGYQSYGWTTQDWRSIKVNSKGDIDYSQKCGAEGTRTKSGKPRLCLPAPVIRSLMKTESGKEVLRTQARKKLRAKKGEKVPWHPRIKKLHKKLEENTPEDR